MGTNSLFINIDLPNNKSHGSSTQHLGGLNKPMFSMKKATSGKGSVAFVRKISSTSKTGGGSQFVRLSTAAAKTGVAGPTKATTVKFGSVTSDKQQGHNTTTTAPVSILKNKQNVTAATGRGVVFKNKFESFVNKKTTKTAFVNRRVSEKIQNVPEHIKQNKFKNIGSNNREGGSFKNNNNNNNTSATINSGGVLQKQQPSEGGSSSAGVGVVTRPATGNNSNGFAEVSRPSGAGGGNHVVSLFTGNPDIPKLDDDNVTPVTEPVFSAQQFASLNISPILVKQCTKLGFKDMTVVQQRGIPPILEGKDVLIKSQTGSGKTLAYALPIVNTLLMMSPGVDRSHGVLALIIVPTRELALQTFGWIQDIAKACVKIVPGYLMGGEKKSSEKKRLRRGVNILVSTPGRLMDHINTTESLALRNVRFLILDEADRMLEMGYEKSISEIIQALTEAKDLGDEKRFEFKKNRDSDFRTTTLGPEYDYNNKRTLPSQAEEWQASKKMKINDGSAVTTNSDEDDSEDEVANPDIDEEEELEDFKSAKTNKPEINMEARVTKVVVAPCNIDSPAPPHQTVLLSATLTQHVQKLAGVSMLEPEIVSMSGDTSKNAWGSETVITPENLVHHITVVPAKHRLVILSAFILSKCLYGSKRKLLVFMATQDMVNYHTALFQRTLARYGQVDKKVVKKEPRTVIESEANVLLQSINTSNKSKKNHNNNKDDDQQQETAMIEPLIDFMQLRGSMPQAERTEVFNKFKKSDSGVLLCTDVASRGVEFSSVDWIVQFTAANSVTDYVHRVGRTSRANTRGDALLILAPSETEYIQQLNQNNITLKEMKSDTILTSFTLRPPQMDPKFYLARSVEDGATKFQLRCEELLLSSPPMLDLAKKAYISFVGAYASYPAAVRKVLRFKDLHLGHYAKSFGLREAPSNLGASAAFKTQSVIRVKKERREKRDQLKLSGVIAQRKGAEPMMATMSEFDSGLDGLAEQISKRKRDNAKRNNHTANRNNTNKMHASKYNNSKPAFTNS